MKIYVKSDRNIHKSSYNMYYAGMKPADIFDVEDLGTTIGNQHVFYVQNPNNTWGYYWGKLPGDNLNLFGEWALPLESLGIDADRYSSDSDVINAVNDKLRSYIYNSKIATELFDQLNIVPDELDWSVSCADSIVIKDDDIGRIGEIHSVRSNIKDSAIFIPGVGAVRYLLEHDMPISDDIKRSRAMHDIKEHDAYMKRIETAKATPYPYGINDELAEAIHELYKFIVKQGLGYSSTLEEAKEYVESKTINYRRSSRYGREDVANQINMLFDWAETNSITPQKLIIIAKQVYDLYLDKHR